jgi:hypothetical protein
MFPVNLKRRAAAYSSLKPFAEAWKKKKRLNFQTANFALLNEPRKARKFPKNRRTPNFRAPRD